MRRVRILLNAQSASSDSEATNDGPANSVTSPLIGEATEATDPWVRELLNRAGETGSSTIEEAALLDAHDYAIAYPLRRDERISGLLLVDAPSVLLTDDTRSILKVLADQVAIAIEDCRLVEANVRLERSLAERERLATLGQMAATVAHEIKNPLSAIKSIAQVMAEDEQVSREYARDLSLIVGETDRLGQSVTQLLSFARREAPAELPMPADQLVDSVVRLFQVVAEKDGISITSRIETQQELGGAAVSAVRVALSNLLLNALQSSPKGGEVIITIRIERETLVIIVEDSGPGVSAELRQRIWQPFFTTRQRGTGLGLAIVRKRMQEAGGTARLVDQRNGMGASFELRVPIAAEML